MEPGSLHQRCRTRVSRLIAPSCLSFLTAAGLGVPYAHAASPAPSFLPVTENAETWAAVSTPQSPPPRQYHSAIYDPVRHRMIVHGGKVAGIQIPAGWDFFSGELGDTWALDLGPEPAWTQVMAQGPSVPRGMGRDAVYDPFEDRMLVFGSSCNNSLFGPITFDVLSDLGAWGLSLGGPPAWDSLDTNTPQPPGRCFFAAVPDLGRRRVIVLGGGYGYLGGGLCNIAPIGYFYHWEHPWAFGLDGESHSWTQLPSIHPAQSRTLLAVLDSRRNRVIMSGGFRQQEYGTCRCVSDGHYGFTRCDDPVLRENVYELVLEDSPVVRAVPTTGAPPRPLAFAAAVYDSLGDRMLFFGGTPVTGPDLEVWELSLGEAPAWRRLDAGPGPPSGSGRTAIYDPRGHAVWLYGIDAQTVWRLQLTRPVGLDIRPGSFGNPVSGRSRGLLTAAVLGDPRLDVGRIDPSTLRLAGASIATRGQRPNDTPMALVDVDGDGVKDLLLHFEAEELELTPTTMTLRLAGRTYEGIPISGEDAIRQVGPSRIARSLAGGTEPATPALLGAQTNPVHGPIRVWLQLEGASEGRFVVIDITGRQILKETIEPGPPRTREITLPELPPGVYLLHAVQGLRVSSSKVCVLR